MIKKVKTSDWKPEGDIFDYTAKFVDWINSINEDFRTRIEYLPFELYKQQAYGWLSDNTSYESCTTDSDIHEFLVKETVRSKTNSLYYSNKFMEIKDADAESGFVKFEAFEAQAIMFFLADCGYSNLYGKPRQVGFTTAINGGIAVPRICFRKNFFCKFIAQDKDKGLEIFRDKILFPYENMPEYIRPEAGHQRGYLLSIFSKEGKSKRSGTNSRIQVDTPKMDAINGGSPNLVLIDEVGFIDILDGIINEGRPTMFWFNPKTRKLEAKRQLIAWGTGGSMGKGAAAYQAVWNKSMKAWHQRDFRYGIVPVFFNAYAREGMTKEHYDAEKERYYSAEGPNQELSKAQFHQHYPMSSEDMFHGDKKTILPLHVINANLDRISRLRANKPAWGFFDPEFDAVTNSEDKYLPGKLTGVHFRQTSGPADLRTTTAIFSWPEQGWENRYFQGTDPINSISGHSKMASAIWDESEADVAALTNFRVPAYKECYVQSILLNVFYGMPFELLENNIGAEYAEYREMKGLDRVLVANKMLPRHMQSGGKWYGISKDGRTTKHIITRLQEFLEMFVSSDRKTSHINSRDFFIQLKTFVEKMTASKFKWQAADLRYHFDDAIDAIIYSYICAECYKHLEPKNSNEKQKESVRTKYVRDKGGNLRLARMSSSGKILGYITP